MQRSAMADGTEIVWVKSNGEVRAVKSSPGRRLQRRNAIETGVEVIDILEPDGQ
jgi:hypothetical protein